MKKIFTIVIFTENKIGLLNRVTSLFTQRHINIESLTTSESEYPGIHRFTVAIMEEEDKTIKVVKQIEKQVEVLKAFYFADEETVHCEIALYKIKFDETIDRDGLNQILKTHSANVNAIEDGFLIIEKTGHKAETHALFEDLLVSFDLQGFVRSGRVSLSKTISTFRKHLKELEEHSKEIITNNS